MAGNNGSLTLPNMKVPVSILPVVADLGGGDDSTLMPVVQPRRHWKVKYQGRREGLVKWQWKTTAEHANQLKLMKYGVLMLSGMVIDVVDLGKIDVVKSHEEPGMVFVHFPQMQVYPWHFAQPANQWKPWMLQVLIGHQFDAKKFNDLHIENLNQLMWDYSMTSLSSQYREKLVMPWVKKHNQGLAMTAEKIKLSQRSQMYVNSIPVDNPLDGYALKTIFKMYADWDSVQRWANWLDSKVVVA